MSEDDHRPDRRAMLAERITSALLRRPPGVTKAEIARIIGVEPQAITGWEKTGKISSENLAHLARILQLQMEYFLPGDLYSNDEAPKRQQFGIAEGHDTSSWEVPMFAAEKSPERVTGSGSIDGDLVEIPVYDGRAAGGQVAFNDGAQKIGSILFRKRSLDKKAISTTSAHVCYVTGDSMLPRLRDGDAILFDTTQNIIKDGRIYVIRWGEGEGAEVQVKRLYKELDGSIRVVSDNPSPEYRDRIVDPQSTGLHIIGRVRWVGSWED